MRITCVCKKSFEADSVETRDGEVSRVYYKLRGNHGTPVGVRKRGVDVCGQCNDRQKEEEKQHA